MIHMMSDLKQFRSDAERPEKDLDRHVTLANPADANRPLVKPIDDLTGVKERKKVPAMTTFDMEMMKRKQAREEAAQKVAEIKAERKAKGKKK